MEKNLWDILDAREQRARHQEELLHRWQTPLLCFTMNIPGPDKTGCLVEKGFQLGNRLLRQALAHKKLLHSEQRCTAAGFEAFYVVDIPAKELKSICIFLEEQSPLGRLFDMDVLIPGGQKTDRAALGHPQRKCLLCDSDARLCARSRTHSVDQLTQAAQTLLAEGLAEAIAQEAVRSLLCEVYATPKPGLVDRNNSGSHQDMDLVTFLRSTAALWPYFRRCVRIGLEHSADRETFALLRAAGLEAEQAMLRVTGGVNTHKGAIFTMGLLCCAAATLPVEQWADPDTLCRQCALLTRGLSHDDLQGVDETNAVTVGQKLYVRYGITGARGQAEAGFPAVRKVGLPILEQGLSQGLSFNDALCAALLHLIAATGDTNLIKRSSLVAQLQLQAALNTLLDHQPFPTTEMLLELDSLFIRQNLSPGGSADLLAATCFLYLLKHPLASSSGRCGAAKP